jgi:eukaryotic-like serine/threonine-protein kinase
LSRGTASYRAPEVLDSNGPKYNKKTDIFALGCIVYEIITGYKLFHNDFAIINYSAKGKLHSVWWPESTEASSGRLISLERLVASMLETDHRRRPSARDIQKELENIRAGIRFGSLPIGLPIQVCVTVILR